MSPFLWQIARSTVIDVFGFMSRIGKHGEPGPGQDFDRTDTKLYPSFRSMTNKASKPYKSANFLKVVLVFMDSKYFTHKFNFFLTI